MILRLFCVAIVLLSASCSRQPTQAAGNPAGQGTAVAAQPAAQPATAQPPTADQPAAAQPSVAAQRAMEPVASAEDPAETSAPPARSATPAREAAPVRERERTVIIPAGTTIRVRLAETLDTRRSRAGERFRAHLDEPIVSGNMVVVPKGTTFVGHVTEARPSGRLKGRAYLGVKLDSFRLHDATYRVVTAPDVRASGRHRKRNLAIIGGGTGGGAAIGALAGGGVGALIGAGAGAAAGTGTAFFTGKKQVRLPVETPLVFRLHQPVKVTG